MSAFSRPTASRVAASLLVALALGGGSISAQGGTEKPPSDEALRQQLESLGYVGATEVSKTDQKKRGVTINKSGASVGWTVWTSTGWGAGFRDVPGQVERRKATLIDQSGSELHSWTGVAGAKSEQGWAKVQVDADGNLYAVDSRSALVKVDWDSRELWRAEGKFHHDLEVGPDGNLWTIRSNPRQVDYKGGRLSVLEESVAVRDPATGDAIREFPTWDALSKVADFDAGVDKWLARQEEDKDPAEKGLPLGILHLNSIHVMRDGIAGLWDSGDFMVCFRNLDIVAVLDKDDGSVKWTWGPGVLNYPHDPTLTSEGHLLVFDNGPSRGWSRVVEMEPRSGKIVWQYRGPDDDPFFSNIRGQTARLESGNTLIIESQRGRAFEVSPEGETVWEYFSPDVFIRSVDPKTGKRTRRKLMRVPFRFSRITGEVLAGLQRRLSASSDAVRP